MIKKWFSRAPAPRLQVLMVCTGNICRSPTAEAVLRSQLEQAGLAGVVAVDSAGTHGFHDGSRPDPRAIEHARRRGYALEGIRSRPLTDDDFERFDLLLAMDHDNLGSMRRRCPPERHDRLSLLLAHAPGLGAETVPDPYYAGPAAFDHALDLIEAGCRGLLPVLRQRLHETS